MCYDCIFTLFLTAQKSALVGIIYSLYLRLYNHIGAYSYTHFLRGCSGNCTNNNLAALHYWSCIYSYFPGCSAVKTS